MRGSEGTAGSPHREPSAGSGGRRPAARQAGGRAEAVAAWLLRRQGFRLIARNVRCRWGELDLVARRGRLLVVVEVRARSAALGLDGVGQAAASVAAAKRRRMLRALRWWLARRPDLQGCYVRLDVVAVALDPAGRPCRAVHLPGAFGADDG